jgi:hypothetical protein
VGAGFRRGDLSQFFAARALRKVTGDGLLDAISNNRIPVFRASRSKPARTRMATQGNAGSCPRSSSRRKPSPALSGR